MREDDGIIRLTKRGFSFQGTHQALEKLQQRFEMHHFLPVKNFLDSEIVALVKPFLETAQFVAAQYKSVGSELLMEQNLAVELLTFLANDERLFDFVKIITGCGPIGSFHGRVFKLIPDPQHVFDWHDDLHESSRLIAMSINLSPDSYSGGLLQIRDARSGEILSEVANTGFGSAVLFRISPNLEHRVTGVEGGVARTSFAGWFKSIPGIYSGLGRVPEDSAMRREMDNSVSGGRILRGR